MRRFFDIAFRGDKSNLLLALDFKGVMVVGYALQLFDSDGNTKLWLPPKSGNNVDQIKDHFELPLPVPSNDKRTLRLKFIIKGIDNEPPNFIITAKLVQEEILVGEASVSGVLTGEEQTVTMFINLKNA